MNIPKEYIKMCEKAIEIRKSHVLKNGDYLIWLASSQERVLIYGCDIYYTIPNSQWDKYIWLPRQDQLQKLIIPFKLPKNCESLGEDCHNLAYHFGLFILNKWDYCIKFKSMEQLWLAFVMWRKYRKKWNKGNWIKIEEGGEW